MPPRKNVAPSNAVLQFRCDICAKGYPRQPDYENHLRSYDHNHRQRLADMKKITARNEAESKPEKRRDGELKSMPLQGGVAGKGFTKIGGGSGFTKVGGSTGGGGFKKVGTAITKETADPKKGAEFKAVTADAKEDTQMSIQDTEDETKLEGLMRQQEELQRRIEEAKAKQAQKQGAGPSKLEPIMTAQSNNTTNLKVDQDVEWGGMDDLSDPDEEYDFTRPTGCNRATCTGCNTDGIWDDNWDDLLKEIKEKENKAAENVTAV